MMGIVTAITVAPKNRSICVMGMFTIFVVKPPAKTTINTVIKGQPIETGVLSADKQDLWLFCGEFIVKEPRICGVPFYIN
jgi:hypothetical protein